MELELVLVQNDGSTRVFKVGSDRQVIGRQKQCDLRIPVPSVSREHCEISIVDDIAIVRDLGSSNGTLVNGKKVEQGELMAGDVLCVGPASFVVRVDGLPDDQDAADLANRAAAKNDQPQTAKQPPVQKQAATASQASSTSDDLDDSGDLLEGIFDDADNDGSSFADFNFDDLLKDDDDQPTL